MNDVTGIVIPDHVAAKLKAGERCDNCRFHHVDKADKQLVCRRLPPQQTILPVPVQQPVVRAQPGTHIQPMPFCGFPLVMPDQWCGEWEAARAP